VKPLKSELKNDRLRLMWQNHLIHGLGFKDKSVDAMLAALTTYENFTQNRPFRLHDQNKAKAFCDYLVHNVDEKRKITLGSSTIVHTLGHVRSFFE
jgi:hypothetical protein